MKGTREMAEIQIKNVAKKFGAYQALHDINLTIADQEFMVLLGASGCGKTTLLRIICGLETATEGEVWIGGRRVDHLAPKDRGIAMVFQNYAVFPHLTVFENIGFGLRMQKLPDDEVRRRVERVASLMHIEMLLKRYSGELSGGQRQRVAVARALAMEPDVILMDEPLSNLDALLRMEMRAELKGVLAESKTTAVYVTHDQVEAMSMADRISVIHQGEIVQAASPIEVYRNPAAEFVASFIGTYIGIWLSHVSAKAVGLAIATTQMSMTPVFMVLLVAIFLRKKISVPAMFGMLLAILGVALLMQQG
mgnify:CR=1 FL=1